MMNESDACITKYVNDSIPQMFGTLKHRFRDFVVREIPFGGGPPVKLTENARPEIEPLAQAELANMSQELATIVGEDAVKDVDNLIGSSKEFLLLPVVHSKEDRTKVHRLIRERWQGQYLTDAVMIDPTTKEIITHVNNTGDMTIRVSIAQRSNKRKSDNKESNNKNHKKGHRVDIRSRTEITEWPNDRPPHIRFVLYKENVDSQHALNMIARNLRTSSDSLQIAGTKDKRAVTLQHVTALKVHAEQLFRAVDSLKKGKNKMKIEVGNVTYVDEPLHLGRHAGNRFDIVLRNVMVEIDNEMINAGLFSETRNKAVQMVENRIDNWQRFGFLNYFGMQRFGTGNQGTHRIGEALLRGSFKETIRLILDPTAYAKDPSWGPMLESFMKTGNVETQLSQAAMTSRVAEAVLLSKLKHFANDMRKNNDALVDIPFDDFNESQFRDAFGAIPYRLRTLYIHAYQSYVFNALLTKRVELYGAKNVVVGDLVRVGADVQVVTPENVASFRITDVVLPLMGTRIDKFPTHEINQAFCENMSGSFDNVWLDKLIPTGDYRNIVVHPSSVEHEWIMYGDEDVNKDFVLSDFDILENVRLKKLSETPTKCALRLSFDLDPSSYATMAFRELFNTTTTQSDLMAGSEMISKVTEEPDIDM